MKITIELDTSIADDLRALNALTGTTQTRTITDYVPNTDTAAVAEPTKRRRRTAEQIAADAAPAQQTAPPASPEPAAQPATPPKSSFLEDDEPAPAKTYTKDDVRAALVALQTKRLGVHVAAGKSQADAAVAAEGDAKKVLTEASGAERLKDIDPSKYGAVIEAANKAAQ